MIPSLLLRPEGSYKWTPENGVQPVVPNVPSTIDIIDGEHGEAWHRSSSGTVSYEGVLDVLDTTCFTILFKGRTTTPDNNNYLFNINNTAGIVLGRVGSHPGNPAFYAGGTNYRGDLTGDIMNPSVWGLSVEDGFIRPYFNGEPGGEQVLANPINTGSWTACQLNASIGAVAESLLIYPAALTDDEIYRISTMEEAWTMENVSTPEMRIKQSGAVERVAGMWTKRNGLLKSVELG